MKKPELNFEEAVFEELAGLKRIEQPIDSKVFILSMVASALIVCLIFSRLAFLNLFKGDFYQNRAYANVNKDIRIPANRGIIFDRFDTPLVKNVPTFSVVLNVVDFFKNHDSVKINLAKISQIINQPVGQLEQIIQEADIEKTDELIIAHGISLDQAFNLRGLGFEALQVKDDYRRQYLDGPIFAHVVGYTGIADQGDAVIGKVGLEAAYDDVLRGTDGRLVKARNVQGDVLDEKTIIESQSGHKLTTTIDAEFQRYFSQRFLEGLKSLGRDSGVGIAMNPQTGEILALLSFPEFDNSRPADYLNQARQPLFNRAISGVYSPGSSFKPFVAIAALAEKVVSPIDEFFSPGYLEIPNPYFPDKPSRFLDWRPQGYVNLFSALARSSNVYFYIVGGGFSKVKGLGIDRLQQYWKIFQFNEKTGIDLLSEAVGFFYTPDEKEDKLGEIWRLGDTYNVSIGQGNLAVTPIRLLSNISFIAADGRAFKPYLASNFIDERGNTVIVNQPQQVADFTNFYPEIYEVQKGLRDAVSKSYGTAHMLNDLPISVSGKTGSAQIANNTKTNAFFVGYAPSDNPEIAILVLIENSREGSSNTLPIAYDVLRWYHYNRMKF